MAHNEDRLVWIFGSSRSGSTWLLHMLSELDGAVAVDDPHLGHHLGVWRPIPLAWAVAEREPRLTTLMDVKRQKPDYFFSDRYRDHWGPALRQLIVARFDAKAREVLEERADGGEPLVVVKEPGSHVSELLLSLFPASRMVFLLRDGRDVVDSWLAAHRPGSWALGEGAFPVTAEGRETLLRWLASVWTYRTEAVQRAYGQHEPSRRIVIRYEHLLRAPAEELERICRAFGVDVGRKRLDGIAQEYSYARVPGSEKGEDKAIRAARPGGWRRTLTEGERRAMHEVMGAKLAELGYLPGYEEEAA